MNTRKTPSARHKAIEGLRDAHLRLDLVYCLNELRGEQEWIACWIRLSKQKIGRMLRFMEPKRRLPNVMDDTELGRSIKEAEADQRRWAKCKHDMKPAKRPVWCPKGGRYES